MDSPCFFTPAIHSRIVQFILDRKRFSIVRSDDFAFGIERLLNEEVYKAAYPLHDVGNYSRFINRLNSVQCFRFTGRLEGEEFHTVLALQQVGLVDQILPLPTSRLRQRVLRHQDRFVFRLAWFLHSYAASSFCCWIGVLCLLLVQFVQE